MKAIIKLFALVLLIISGCTFNPFFQDDLPKEDKLFAEKYIEVLQSNDIDKARSLFSDDLLQSNTEWLDTIMVKINKEEVKNKKLVYQKILNRNNPYRATLSYELEYTNYWLLTEVTIDKIDDDYKIAGLYYYPLSGTFEDLTTFKLSGKSFTHYLMLAISASIVMFIVYALIICIKTPIKKKWLWIISILLGISKISFVWSSGTFDYQIISFQLLGFGFIKHHPYGSWILSISIPIGAILFLLKRRKIIMKELIATDHQGNIASSG